MLPLVFRGAVLVLIATLLDALAAQQRAAPRFERYLPSSVYIEPGITAALASSSHRK